MKKAQKICGFSLLLVLLIITTGPLIAKAKVIRIEVESRTAFADGAGFGKVGAYEILSGKLYYAVDPELPNNTGITDLQFAPRNQDGQVEFVSEFELLKPVDLSRGNHRLLYDILNRGNKTIMGAMNMAWGNTLRPGNGYLMEQGYSVLWSGWNWDVRDENGWLQIEVPIATKDGQSIEQFIVTEMVNTTATEALPVMEMFWTNTRGYPPLDYQDNTEATLTVRKTPKEQPLKIPNEQWSFTVIKGSSNANSVPAVEIKSGFKPGHIYELTYRVSDPPVIGLGLAAVRDAISFFHFEKQDHIGNQNPLLRQDGSGSDIEKAYVYGSSQSGRFIAQMLWQGFHVDEANRMVFEGARIRIAGGGKGGFNHRFGMTSQHMVDLEGNCMPSDHPPFNYLPDDAAGSGGMNDILALSKQQNQVPCIILTNNEYEYWSRSASLIHTNLTGTQDAPLHDNVRLYVFNGAPHRAAYKAGRGVCEHPVNRLDVHSANRALLSILDQWVSDGLEPPASRYPRIDRGELVSAARHKQQFPKTPELHHPGRNFQPARIDYGPRFWDDGIMTMIPPVAGEPYRTLVPSVDGDGNSLGGVRLPELLVPLGSYLGWNPRNEKFGDPDYFVRFEGSFLVFPTTDERGRASDDQRVSIEVRYPTRDAYVEAIQAACNDLVRQRFLLPESVSQYVDLAQKMSWPPVAIDNYPYWKTE
ncbi:MAG: hypothetical protein GY780_08765 [bacterium]|nr:hypothetical protein [bacterium]